MRINAAVGLALALMPAACLAATDVGADGGPALGVSGATADRIFHNVTERGEAGDAFDGGGFFLCHQESAVEWITVNAVANKDAQDLYQDRSPGHFQGLTIVHTLRTPGCPGENEDGRKLIRQDSWIYDMAPTGAVYDGGHHAFCVVVKNGKEKRLKNPRVADIDATLASAGAKEDFAKIAPLLPRLEKKGAPFWPVEKHPGSSGGPRS